MAMMKAVSVMIIFSLIMYYVINLLGLNETHGQPLFALIGSVLLLFALIGNVTIFLKVAGEEPFKWFK